jgi:acyl carrier protein
VNQNSMAQRALIGEVKRILNEVDVRPYDNFIELGGNSFLAIQVALNLKDKEGIEIDISQLLGDKLEKVMTR